MGEESLARNLSCFALPNASILGDGGRNCILTCVLGRACRDIEWNCRHCLHSKVEVVCVERRFRGDVLS